MTLQGIDHFTIRASDVAASRGFYTDVLGLTEGERPPFKFPGAWLYLGPTPVVHLIGGRDPRHDNTGPLDHVAFRATGLAATKSRLDAAGVVYRERTVPLLQSIQLFVNDPDGILIELNFGVAEA